MVGISRITRLIAFAVMLAPPAWAQTQPDAATAPAGLWDRTNLLGTGGVRETLDGYGISLGLVNTSDLLANPTGGRRQGAVYEGLSLLTLGVDLEKSAGLAGTSFNLSVENILGRGLARGNLLSLTTPSSLELEPATALNEVWLQQKFADGKADVRIGQLAADGEFMTSLYGALFVNSGFGWATLPVSDLPSGGNYAPLATPGVRLHVQASDAVALLAGVYNGNPAGPGTGNAQRRDLSGTDFRTGDGVLVILEAQLAVGQGEGERPGTYKLGGWYNSNRFADQLYDATGVILSKPASSGLPRQHRGDYSLYAGFDQLVARAEGVKDGGLGVFARVMGAPGDRKLVSIAANAGMSLKGVLFGREDDTLGLGIAYTKISNAAQTADLVALQSGTAVAPVRSQETAVELTYQMQVAGWWQIQPDIQYIFNPGGGGANPDQPRKRLGDALVVGVRSVVTF